ncbi:MAG: c-type cytochrome [Acidobacteria bacterium]|nr:c-type cytochrome [Acidobacteriota bacterium]
MLFEEKCTTCHTLGSGDFLGPDLAGVADRRPREWLLRFIVEPDRVLAEGDPVALELLKKYSDLEMPNLKVTLEEAEAALAYIATGGAAAGAAAAPSVPPASAPGAPAAVEPLGPQWRMSTQVYIGLLFLAAVILTAAAFLVVYKGSQPRAEYEKFERVFDTIQRYWTASLVIATLLFTVALLPLVPFPPVRAATEETQVVKVEALQFGWNMEPRTVKVGTPVEFRVTGRDVNHSFGLVDPHGVLLFQVQAMPRYVKEAVYTFDEPGTYHVLCMEYCGLAHHVMRTTVQVVR